MTTLRAPEEWRPRRLRAPEEWRPRAIQPDIFDPVRASIGAVFSDAPASGTGLPPRTDRPFALTRGLVTGAGEMPKSIGLGLQVLGRKTGIETGERIGRWIEGMAAPEMERYRLQDKSLWDAEDPEEFFGLLGEKVGAAGASTITGLAGAGLGAAAGLPLGPPGVIAGSRVGAGAVFVPMNIGDAYEALRELRPDMPADEIDQLAMKTGGAVGALDVIGANAIMRGMSSQLRKELWRRIVRRALDGTLWEGGTEGVQELIQMDAEDLATGKLTPGKVLDVTPGSAMKRLKRASEAAVIGGVIGTGGAVGGIEGVPRRGGKNIPEIAAAGRRYAAFVGVGMDPEDAAEAALDQSVPLPEPPVVEPPERGDLGDTPNQITDDEAAELEGRLKDAGVDEALIPRMVQAARDDLGDYERFVAQLDAMETAERGRAAAEAPEAGPPPPGTTETQRQAPQEPTETVREYRGKINQAATIEEAEDLLVEFAQQAEGLPPQVAQEARAALRAALERRRQGEREIASVGAEGERAPADVRKTPARRVQEAPPAAIAPEVGDVIEIDGREAEVTGPNTARFLDTDEDIDLEGTRAQVRRQMAPRIEPSVPRRPGLTREQRSALPVSLKPLKSTDVRDILDHETDPSLPVNEQIQQVRGRVLEERRMPKAGEPPIEHGGVERLYAALFRRSPEPTTKELASLPGAPVARPGDPLTRNMAPTDYRVVRDKTEEYLGKGTGGWHADFGGGMHQIVGDGSIGEAVGVFSILSPELSPDQNLAGTLHVMTAVREIEGELSPNRLAAYIWNHRKRADGKFVKMTKSQAVRLADFYTTATYDGEPKTGNFALNLLQAAKGRPFYGTVNDVHIARALGFKRKEQHGEKLIDKPAFRSVSEYRYATYIISKIAQGLGVSPDRAQAALWAWASEKLVSERKGKGGGVTWEQALRYAQPEVVAFLAKKGGKAPMGEVELGSVGGTYRVSSKIQEFLNKAATETGMAPAVSTAAGVLGDVEGLQQKDLLALHQSVWEKLKDRTDRAIELISRDLGLDHIVDHIKGFYLASEEFTFRLRMPFAKADQVKMVAALLGDAWRQKEVIWYRQVAKGKGDRTGLVISKVDGSAFADEELRTIKDVVQGGSVEDGQLAVETLHYSEYTGLLDDDWAAGIKSRLPTGLRYEEREYESGRLLRERRSDADDGRGPKTYAEALRGVRGHLRARLRDPAVKQRILDRLYGGYESAYAAVGQGAGWPALPAATARELFEPDLDETPVGPEGEPSPAEARTQARAPPSQRILQEQRGRPAQAGFAPAQEAQRRFVRGAARLHGETEEVIRARAPRVVDERAKGVEGGAMVRYQRPAEVDPYTAETTSFYSEVRRRIEEKGPERGSPQQFLGLLVKRKGDQEVYEPGIKKEEVEWLDLEGWFKARAEAMAHAGKVLDALPENVTVGQVIDRLREGVVDTRFINDAIPNDLFPVDAEGNKISSKLRDDVTAGQLIGALRKARNVSKQEVLGFIEQNIPLVEEVVRAGRGRDAEIHWGEWQPEEAYNLVDGNDEIVDTYYDSYEAQQALAEYLSEHEEPEEGWESADGPHLEDAETESGSISGVNDEGDIFDVAGGPGYYVYEGRTFHYLEDAQHVAQQDAAGGATAEGAPKWTQYTTPDAENHFELVMRLPDFEPEFFQPLGDMSVEHYPESNIVVHMRMNERRDKDGNWWLHADEIQSDVHQQAHTAIAYEVLDAEGKVVRREEDASDAEEAVAQGKGVSVRKVARGYQDAGVVADLESRLKVATATRQRVQGLFDKTLRELRKRAHAVILQWPDAKLQRYEEGADSGQAMRLLALARTAKRDNESLRDLSLGDVLRQQYLHHTGNDIAADAADLIGPQEIEAGLDAVVEETDLDDQLATQQKRIPGVPFKSAHELAFKRMLRWAAEHGYHGLAWTTGHQQAERWSAALQLHVERLELEEKPSGGYVLRAYRTVGGVQPVMVRNVTSQTELVPLLGIEASGQLMSQEPAGPEQTGRPGLVRELELGRDVKLDSPDVLHFYDKVYPSFVGRYVKKWGGRMTTVDMGSGPQPGVVVTPKMRESILATQDPLFQRPTAQDVDRLREALGQIEFPIDAQGMWLQDHPAIIRLFRTANPTTLIHELSHWHLREIVEGLKKSNPRQLRLLERWSGLKEGTWTGSEAIDWDAEDIAGNKVYEPAEEKWAGAIVNSFFGDRKIPNVPSRVRQYIEQFREWLRKLVASIAGRQYAEPIFRPDMLRFLQQYYGDMEELRGMFRGETSVPETRGVEAEQATARTRTDIRQQQLPPEEMDVLLKAIWDPEKSRERRPGEQLRRLPQSLEAAGRESGVNLYYRRISNDETEAKAREVIQREDLGELQALLSSDDEASLVRLRQMGVDDVGATRAALALGVVALRQGQAQRLRTAAQLELDPTRKAEFDAAARVSAELAVNMATSASERATRLGQEVQALSMIARLDPATVLLYAARQIEVQNQERGKGQKARSPEGRKLTVEESKKLTDLAQEAQTWEAFRMGTEPMGDILKRLREGQTLMPDDMKFLGEFALRIRQVLGVEEEEALVSGKPKARRSPVAKILEGRLDRMEKAAIARLKAKGIRISAGLPVDILADYAAIGAARIGKVGLKYAEWTVSMGELALEGFETNVAKVWTEAQHRFRIERSRASRMARNAKQIQQLIERVEQDPDLMERPDYEALGALAAELKEMTGEAQYEAAQQLKVALRDLDAVSAWRKVEVGQTIGQLLNLKTVARNVIGNELFFQLDKSMQNFIATPFDLARSRLTGGNRYVAFRTSTAGDYWRGFFEGARLGWKGISPEALGTQYDLGTRGPAFARGELLRSRREAAAARGERVWMPKSVEVVQSYLESTLGAALRGFDYAAYVRARNSVLRELANLAWINRGREGNATQAFVKNFMANADEWSMDIADLYAKYVTFQDDNILSETAVSLKRKLNLHKDFGFGSLILKYPKAPSNLFNRALAYTPAGVLRSAYILSKPYMKGNHMPDPREATLALGRAIMGSGLSAMGIHLFQLGILSGADEDDEDLRKLRAQQTGERGWQVNLSGLMRYVRSSFRDSAAAKREGDMLVSYDWAMPVSISAAMGVEFGAGLKDVGHHYQGILGTPPAAVEAFLRSTRVLAEQPMVQGLRLMFEGYGREEGMFLNLARVAEQLPSSFVPTFFSQIRQATDNTQRITWSPSFPQRAINRAIYKLPFVNQSLPKVYKTLGLDMPAEAYQNGGGKAAPVWLWHVFVNPAFVAEYHVDPEVAAVLGVYEQTGEQTGVPRVAPRRLTISPTMLNKFVGARKFTEQAEFYLKPDDMSDLQRTMARHTTINMRQARAKLAGKSADQQLKLLTKAVNDAMAESREWFARTHARQYLREARGD